MRKISEEVYIYGDISNDVFVKTDMSAKKFKDLIDDIKDAEELRIHINSFGGAVLAGFGIITIIENFKKNTGAKVVIYIDGTAAGIASAIAMSGDEIYMARNAMFMIRNPYIFVAGDDCDIERKKEDLKKFEDMLVANYMKRFNGTEVGLRQLMSDETWFSAEEAVNHGFVDKVID